MKAFVLWILGLVVALAASNGCRSSGEKGGSNLHLRIDGLDYAPAELERQAPFECTFVRVLRGPDRPDYMLFSLAKPLDWKGQKATHLVLAARWVGTAIAPKIRNMPVGIAIVKDPTLLASNEFRLEQADYAAIGVATDLSADAP